MESKRKKQGRKQLREIYGDMTIISLEIPQYIADHYYRNQINRTRYIRDLLISDYNRKVSQNV